MKDVKFSLRQALAGVVEHAVVSYSSMFETFVLCWTLNYLLNVLESGGVWAASETSLAGALSPIGPKAVHRIPGIPDVLRGLPWLKEQLQGVSNVATDPVTGKEYDSPLSPELNALSGVLFWRDYRNLLVHRSGIVSTRFLQRHSAYVAAARAQFEYLPDLEVGRRLALPDAVYRAVAATHYRVAKWMHEYLRTRAQGRRSHAFAPDAYVEGRSIPTGHRSNPLLMPGDHEQSYEFWHRARNGGKHEDGRDVLPPIPDGTSV